MQMWCWARGLLSTLLAALVLMPSSLWVRGAQASGATPSSPTGPAFTDPNRVALVVSAANHHYEIAAFFAEQLRGLDMDLHIWLNKHAGASFGNVQERLFSNFSSKISLIHKNNMEDKVPTKIKLLVYVSMDTSEEVQALCPSSRLHETLFDRAEAVLMVNHHSHSVLHVLSYCRPPKCSIVHLGAHVDAHARQLLLRQHLHAATAASTPTPAAASADYKSLVLVPIFQPPMAAQLFPAVEGMLRSASNRTRIVAVQGNMISYRRNYSALFTCVQSLRAEGRDVRVILLGSQASKLSVPTDMQSIVTMVRNAAFDEFYATIGRAHLLAMFANPDTHYDYARATSTTPTGVMSETPVVLTQHMLSIYPCLRDSPAYRQVAQTEDCASLSAAVRLSDEDLAALREETKRCKRQWHQQSRSALGDIIAAAVPAPPTASSEAKCCRCTDDLMTR